MSNMKQGTLSFASAKRTRSIPKGKSQQRAWVTGKAKIKRVETSPEAKGTDEKPSDVHEISSDDEEAAAAQIRVPVKRTRASTKRASSGATKQAPAPPSQPEKQKPFSAQIEREHLDVDDKAGRYRKYYNEVRSKMGHIPPVHSEGQNRIHQMLRFFDMSYEFGPCIGMSRLERWERAEAFGLDPPVEIRDILLTKQGTEKPEYAQCVLDTEV